MSVFRQPERADMPISSKNLWKKAWIHSLPVAMGYYPAGIAFGVLMSAANLPLLLTILSSLIVYSGAAQYASIPLFAAGAGVFSLTLNTAIINLRHIFYGIPLLPYFPQALWQRVYCYFALTDESFSLLTTLPENERQSLFIRIVGLNQFYWLSASIIGYLLGAQLNAWIPNLDFALPCLFMILWYEQFGMNHKIWPSILAMVAFLLAKTLAEDYVLLLSVAFSALGIVLYPHLVDKGKNGARIGFSGSLILILALMAYLHYSSPEINAITQAQGEVASLPWQILAIVCMGAVTFLLRFAPAAIPRAWIQSPRLRQLNTALPLSVMSILILSSLHLDAALKGDIGSTVAQVAALMAVCLVYHLRKNVLLGMVIGVLVFNLLVSI